jgi:hypothetical protein
MVVSIALTVNTPMLEIIRQNSGICIHAGYGDSDFG